MGQPYPDLDAAYRAAGTWGLWCVMVPLTLLVLGRPNADPETGAPDAAQVPRDSADR
jgi:hypothetical protein